MPFQDRRQAGRALAELLGAFRSDAPVVIALPRGGVVVGGEVAHTVSAPLDVVVVRKLRTPDTPALGLGAIAEDDVQVLLGTMLYEAGLSPVGIEPIVAVERAELAQQLDRYRAVRPAVALADRTVLLVDDGLTTGASATAAVRVIRGRGARRVVMAVPVSSREAREALADDVDEIVCVETPPLILALDEWYEDFPEISDDEVVALLAEAAMASLPPTAGS